MNDKGRRALLMGGAAASLQLWWLRVLTKKFHFYGNITMRHKAGTIGGAICSKHVGTNTTKTAGRQHLFKTGSLRFRFFK